MDGSSGWVRVLVPPYNAGRWGAKMKEESLDSCGGAMKKTWTDPKLWELGHSETCGGTTPGLTEGGHVAVMRFLTGCHTPGSGMVNGYFNTSQAIPARCNMIFMGNAGAATS